MAWLSYTRCDKVKFGKVGMARCANVKYCAVRSDTSFVYLFRGYILKSAKLTKVSPVQTCLRFSGLTRSRLARACSASNRASMSGRRIAWTHLRYSLTSMMAIMAPVELNENWCMWSMMVRCRRSPSSSSTASPFLPSSESRIRAMAPVMYCTTTWHAGVGITSTSVSGRKSVFFCSLCKYVFTQPTMAARVLHKHRNCLSQTERC